MTNNEINFIQEACVEKVRTMFSQLVTDLNELQNLKKAASLSESPKSENKQPTKSATKK